MRVSVIIPARDAAQTLPRARSAIDAQEGIDRDDIELIVEGDPDRTGPASTRNRGAARATAPVLAFTDADCTPTPQWLRHALARIDAGADLVQGAVLPPPGVPIGPWDRFIWVERPHGLFETANLVITKPLFRELDGFESILQPASGIELGEDVWLGWRARRAGAQVEFAPDALVHHDVHPRGWRDYVRERGRLSHFPPLVARIPELRDVFLTHRCFLTPRSERFDLALAGLALAALTRKPWPLVAAAPYVKLATTSRQPERMAGEALADAYGAAVLFAASLRHRTPVL